MKNVCSGQKPVTSSRSSWLRLSFLHRLSLLPSFPPSLLLSHFSHRRPLDSPSLTLSMYPILSYPALPSTRRDDGPPNLPLQPLTGPGYAAIANLQTFPLDRHCVGLSACRLWPSQSRILTSRLHSSPNGGHSTGPWRKLRTAQNNRTSGDVRL